MGKWIYPGSFDPPTLGHEDIILRASRLCGELVVAVMENPQKAGSFTLGQRVEMLKILCDPLDNVSVVTYDGLQKDLYRAVGAGAVVRGIRGAADLEYEMHLSQVNAGLLPGFETVLLPAKPGLTYMSSSYVRQIIYFGGEYGFMLPKGVEQYISNVLKGGGTT